MKVLSLELSSARGSLAWSGGEKEPVVQEWPNDRKNSGAFFQNLAEFQKKFGAPDRIIVGLGPGSYAGTRIAISAAIGLQHATRAELVGYPSICALDLEDAEFCVIGDARRRSFFFARVRARELVEGPSLSSEDDLRAKLKALNGKLAVVTTEKLAQFERAELRFPSATVLARLAHDPKRSFVWPPLEPMYLREPHITLPKPFSNAT